MKLGANILQLLENKNMTQKKFAETIGISPQALNNYIWSRSNPDYLTLQLIAAELGTSPDYLLGLDSNKVSLNAEEKLLIKAYRSADTNQKETLISQAKLVVKQNAKPKN